MELQTIPQFAVQSTAKEDESLFREELEKMNPLLEPMLAERYVAKFKPEDLDASKSGCSLLLV